MTERQAWLTIAEAYATPRGERTGDQKSMTRFGICNALIDFGEHRMEMRIKVIDDRALVNRPRSSCDGYFCSWKRPSNDLLRADFCYLQYFMLGGAL